MLRLKTTFNRYTNEISEQMKKSIVHKYIDQIVQGVLDDITKESGQAVKDKDTTDQLNKCREIFNVQENI